jgi:rhodanese-related sulfurtransferase
MEFSEYISHFDYRERSKMRIDIEEMLELYKKGKAQIVDIRFPEEVMTWDFNITKKIPLKELPSRLNELERDKIIITVCPHSDRSALARHYLILEGFECKYLSDGLIGLANYFRGGKARDFIADIQ